MTRELLCGSEITKMFSQGLDRRADSSPRTTTNSVPWTRETPLMVLFVPSILSGEASEGPQSSLVNHARSRVSPVHLRLVVLDPRPYTHSSVS